MNTKNKLVASAAINFINGALSFIVLVWLIIEANVAVTEFTSTADIFKYFTVQSNVISGAVSIAFAVYAVMLIKGKIGEIPGFLYILRLLATTSVSLTMITVLVYLGPLFGYVFMLSRYNFFYHLLLPLLAIVSFLFFDITDKISFKQTFIALSHFGVYAIVYLSLVLTHIEDGAVPAAYDWYSFTYLGINAAFIIAAVLLVVTYAIAFGLWKVNAIVYKKQKPAV